MNLRVRTVHALSPMAAGEGERARERSSAEEEGAMAKKS